MSDTPLMKTRAVGKSFAGRGALFRRAPRLIAVDGVSLTIHAREIVALVGESGSGKTTLGRMILGLTPPSAGAVLHDGADVRLLRGSAWRAFRRDVQVVFQDSGAALNPRRTIAQSIAVPLIHSVGLDRRAARAQADALLERVQLSPARFRDRLPHELSGGQRQRVGIARAIACRPRLIVADEPVSALDVSVRAQVLQLMRDLQREADGPAFLLITHDFGVVRALADRVAVMRGGMLVEQGPVRDVLYAPAHDYTKALLAAVPTLHPGVAAA